MYGNVFTEFDKGSKSAERGPNPLADMDRGIWTGGPYPLADLDRGVQF